MSPSFFSCLLQNLHDLQVFSIVYTLSEGQYFKRVSIIANLLVNSQLISSLMTLSEKQQQTLLDYLRQNSDDGLTTIPTTTPVSLPPSLHPQPHSSQNPGNIHSSALFHYWSLLGRTAKSSFSVAKQIGSCWSSLFTCLIFSSISWWASLVNFC